MEVKSQIKAIVWKVLKEAGDTIKIDDEIVILESMKMEIPVESPGAGTLSQVLVEPDEQVEEDQVVAVIES